MARDFDLILSCASDLIKNDQIYFLMDKDFNRVHCICNFCRCNIFLGITIKNFSTFKNILEFHRSNKLRVHHQVFKFSGDWGFFKPGLTSYKRYSRKEFICKLSRYFTEKHFNKIRNKVSVIIIKGCIVHLRCQLCSKEFLMHFYCNLLSTFVEHFAANHKKLLENLTVKERLYLPLGYHEIRDLFREQVKKLVRAQQNGFFKSILSYFKVNRVLKHSKNQDPVMLFNHGRFSNSYLYDQNSASPKNVLSMKPRFKNSRDIKNVSLVPYHNGNRTINKLIIIEKLFDFISNVPVQLTEDQVYFIVNNRQTIDCICNICFRCVFKHITRENFNSFKEKLEIHLYDVMHRYRLMLFIVGRGSISTSNYYKNISTKDPDFRHKFLGKISENFTKNRFLIQSNLEVKKLRNNFVLISCELCTKEFVMNVNCELKTSLVAHLKNPLHKKEIKKICDTIGKPKQIHHYCSQLDEEKFIEIMSKLEKSAKISNERILYCLSVVTNLTGDKKLFCLLCQRTLPYNCEQPVQRLVKLVEYHVNNSVNHFIPIFLLNSKVNLEIKENLPLMPYGTSVIESIFDFMSSIPVHLTDDQVYFIVSNRQNIDCICNLCFCHVFKNITRENFHLFKQKLSMHLSDVLHCYHQATSFLERSSISTSDPNFMDRFTDKISEYFLNKSFLIKSKLDVRKLRNNIVLVSCDFCTKEFVMHVDCELKTSIVAHLKDSVHKKEVWKIFYTVSEDRQTLQYRLQVDKEKFFAIMVELEKHTKIPKESIENSLSVETDVTGNQKLFCLLCQHTLLYDCEQPIQKIAQLVEYHVNNCINHSAPNFSKKVDKYNWVKWNLHCSANCFRKGVPLCCNLSSTLHKKIKPSVEKAKTKQICSKHSNSREKVETIRHIHKLYIQTRLNQKYLSHRTTKIGKSKQSYVNSSEIGGIKRNGVNLENLHSQRNQYKNVLKDSIQTVLKENETKIQNLVESKVDETKKNFSDDSKMKRYEENRVCLEKSVLQRIQYDNNLSNNCSSTATPLQGIKNKAQNSENSKVDKTKQCCTSNLVKEGNGENEYYVEKSEQKEDKMKIFDNISTPKQIKQCNSQFNIEKLIDIMAELEKSKNIHKNRTVNCLSLKSNATGDKKLYCTLCQIILPYNCAQPKKIIVESLVYHINNNASHSIPNLSQDVGQTMKMCSKDSNIKVKGINISHLENINSQNKIHQEDFLHGNASAVDNQLNDLAIEENKGNRVSLGIQDLQKIQFQNFLTSQLISSSLSLSSVLKENETKIQNPEKTKIDHTKKCLSNDSKLKRNGQNRGCLEKLDSQKIQYDDNFSNGCSSTETPLKGNKNEAQKSGKSKVDKPKQCCTSNSVTEGKRENKCNPENSVHKKDKKKVCNNISTPKQIKQCKFQINMKMSSKNSEYEVKSKNINHLVKVNSLKKKTLQQEDLSHFFGLKFLYLLSKRSCSTSNLNNHEDFPNLPSNTLSLNEKHTNYIDDFPKLTPKTLPCIGEHQNFHEDIPNLSVNTLPRYMGPPNNLENLRNRLQVIDDKRPNSPHMGPPNNLANLCNRLRVIDDKRPKRIKKKPKKKKKVCVPEQNLISHNFSSPSVLKSNKNFPPKKILTSKRKRASNKRIKFGGNRDILTSKEDFIGRCQSSMSKSKKLELKLQKQKSFSTYSPWIFNPKAQRVYDFNKSRKLMAKRRLKEKQICKYFQGLKVHKNDFLTKKKLRCVQLSGEKVEIRHHQRNPLLYLTEIRLQRNNFSALTDVNVLSMTEEEEEENGCYQQVQKISKKKRQRENRVRLNTVEKYINDYLCHCFEILIDDREFCNKNKFFAINSYGKRYLFCMFCRYALPFNCDLPQEELCYLSISHLDSCLSNLL